MSGGLPGMGSVSRIPPAWLFQIDDAVRGLASGMLVGVPVVFTVDAWWQGEQNSPRDSLFMLLVTYLITIAAVTWIGFHRGRRRGWQHLADAAEAVALAIVALFIVFAALGQLADGQPASVDLGRLTIALAPVSLGVAAANNLFSGARTREAAPSAHGSNGSAPTFADDWRLSLHEFGAALAGALFICLAIVPGDELDDIATAVPRSNLWLVAVLSLLVSYVVVFASDFAGEARRRTSSGLLQHPVVETVSAFAMALVAAAVALYLFGHVDSATPPMLLVTKIVLLGFPAAVGAAAGRLAI
jgi:putative integral membrane protein (TIGR02587 family)